MSYSIDNLPPPVPSPFVAAYASGATHLHWGVNPAPDFATFRLHRGATEDFVPEVANLLTTSPDTGYVDAGPAGRFYKISATDENGNQSAFALLSPTQTTGVTTAQPLRFALDGVRPNPATARSLTVRFVLPVRASARLELLDVSGRAVITREVGPLGAGMHAVDLTRHARVLPGLYFVRLRQGANQSVARVTVLD